MNLYHKFHTMMNISTVDRLRSLPRGPRLLVGSYLPPIARFRARQLLPVLRRRPRAMANVGNIRMLGQDYGLTSTPTAMQLQDDYRQYARGFVPREAVVVRYLSLMLGRPEYAVRNAIRLGTYSANRYNTNRNLMPYGRRRLIQDMRTRRERRVAAEIAASRAIVRGRPFRRPMPRNRRQWQRGARTMPRNFPPRYRPNYPR